MSLDMQGDGRFQRDVHYRRYLHDDGRIRVVCVQDFDYGDFDPSRFVDLQLFGSEEEGLSMPLHVQDVLEQIRELDEDDDEGLHQSVLIVSTLRSQLFPDRSRWVTGLGCIG
jgi:hypothetical protein